MSDRIPASTLENSISQSAGQLVDLATIRQIQNDFGRVIVVSLGEATSDSTFDDQKYWDEVERIAPSNEELRASVVRFPVPQEWLEEDQDQPF